MEEEDIKRTLRSAAAKRNTSSKRQTRETRSTTAAQKQSGRTTRATARQQGRFVNESKVSKGSSKSSKGSKKTRRAIKTARDPKFDPPVVDTMSTQLEQLLSPRGAAPSLGPAGTGYPPPAPSGGPFSASVPNPFGSGGSLPGAAPATPLPEIFKQALVTRRDSKLFPDPDLYNYYANELTRRDSRSIPGMGGTPSLLYEILASNAESKFTGNWGIGWRPVKTLGEGAQGKVMLWELMRDEKPPLQIVTKDSMLDPFFKDYNSEGHLTKRLNDAGCKNAVKVLEWATVGNTKMRCAYEYADYGTLWDLIKYYTIHRLMIPEAFMWHVFNSLATALCYLAHGRADGSRDPSWEAIIHGDIKPENILLFKPDAQSGTLYPTVKLGDFGHAYTIPNEKVRRFKSAFRHGTPCMSSLPL
ncbi:kinase-like protein [Xylona heveae TC161]|uniref:Kinase-like protein n=1 Tax=Xylona heveae (strain CBS 132557 / TC161) TaxID=1328760 RepID=A0A164ZCX9_XYLHT|nr:kinase-like protein [Xylona heveae TC161]KZF18948.1 kinase-like protein [Xylona heveae TC161]